jgi:hypothetical protein
VLYLYFLLTFHLSHSSNIQGIKSLQQKGDSGGNNLPWRNIETICVWVCGLPSFFWTFWTKNRSQRNVPRVQFWAWMSFSTCSRSLHKVDPKSDCRPHWWYQNWDVMSPEFTKELSFNLRDTGSHVPDHSPVVGTLFCIGFLTMGSRLCMFCSLHFWTLQNHYCTTIQNMICMLGLKPFLIGKAVAIWCRMVSGLFSSLFFILDTLECICWNTGIVTLAQTY